MSPLKIYTLFNGSIIHNAVLYAVDQGAGKIDEVATGNGWQGRTASIVLNLKCNGNRIFYNCIVRFLTFEGGWMDNRAQGVKNFSLFPSLSWIL